MAAQSNSVSLYHVLVVLIVAATTCYGATENDQDVYIVYMGSRSESEYSPMSHHLTLLQQVLGESSDRDCLVRSYGRSFNAFAARLSEEERQKLADKKEVLSVFPSRTLQLQTTRSWDFIGLTEKVKRNPTVESDIIVGVIDSGIWPESESFSDQGFGPPPMKWKGTCAGGNNFTCNNKLIGARSYSPSDDGTSARDEIGHGTHTASTAAGSNVAGASFYGIAEGNARGGVPSARIAVYKVCNEHYGCTEKDILGAFDDAIADRVDIITISIGGNPIDFEYDAIAIGSFHALDKGILTVQSAGNRGPVASTVGSIAPWVFSVAASSTDRRIIDKVVLGNGKELPGNTINPFALNGTKTPLVYGKDTTSSCSDAMARLCDVTCLDRSLVKDKIVVCDSAQGSVTAFRAGALGAITLDASTDVAYEVPFPSSDLTIENLDVVKSYINSTKNPQANILKSEAIKDTAAPIVASFSSRGPNSIAGDILKPDITAPGIDILAAYPPLASLFDDKSVKYNILSGTSMSCPHVAGAAAYLKTFHPQWSPSAIKSALMTTAWQMNATKEANYSDGEFAFGVGHINPVKATDPGLVYETSKDDYIKMLCSMRVNFFGTCPKDIKGSPKDLNYPSMQVQVEANNSFKVEFPRTVTNVGFSNSTYKSKVISDSQIKLSVEPSILSFKSLDEKKSFVVTVSGVGLLAGKRLSASLVWSDDTHTVRSPIIVYTNI